MTRKRLKKIMMAIGIQQYRAEKIIYQLRPMSNKEIWRLIIRGKLLKVLMIIKYVRPLTIPRTIKRYASLFRWLGLIKCQPARPESAEGLYTVSAGRGEYKLIDEATPWTEEAQKSAEMFMKERGN